MLGFLQRIGRALMLPIAVLPAAGLVLRLGALWHIPFMEKAGNSIFENLAILFAIGVAIGFSKDGNGAAALAGAIGYFVLTSGATAIDKTINVGVLGGIVSGIVAGLLYNRFHNIKLPDYLGFFAGKRFVPIVTAGAMVVLAGVFGFAWPPIQDGIEAIGHWVVNAGAFGAAVFGFLNRLLIPLGLHHVLNNFIWFVFGDYKNAHGDLWRFFAGDPSAGFYMAGFFPIMMFGLPAACLAMIMAAKKEKRKAVAGMLLGLAFTSFLTGITEPIEFSFMFLSPLLYVIHALLTAVSMAVAVLLNIHHGFTFSAGAIDYFLNLDLATRPWLLVLLGLVFAAVYYVVFYALIVKLNLKTPGREDEDDESIVEDTSEGAGDDKYDRIAARYLAALGGADNLEVLDNCVTRLRLKVIDVEKVNEPDLKKAGARAVLKLSSTDVQVVVGTDVEAVAEAMRKIISKEERVS
ncbi:N-acetylglucosamine-specific PTS transporter subunit IIBC [Fictibacillus sp. KU28468]|uniref:N-acetylglucosamine-specific PTS transporter subunit IIBC n=1 Tax=Fictibacillus sp. KU28468 TaxID=2991053 RepID=UPI0006A77E64|nr:N-acetylglucosamine-specific PTS transporter subunit IIBC [Fictibacillus sp. KU28468]UZJ80190.1 N-acetylglucosamine-specific PTS transporter subunit IIBC [Fictibacillus sp. KU28468]